MLGLLLTTRLRGLWNALAKGGAKKARKKFGLVGYLILVVVLTVTFYQIFHRLHHFAGSGSAIPGTLLGVLLHGLLILLVFSGVPVVLHFFFLSKDFSLLFSAPIKQSTLFQFKYIEALFANSSVFWAFGLPTMLGYGLAVSAPMWYYPLALFSAFLFLALPTGLAVFLSMALVRLLPAKRAKNIAALVVGMIFIGVWLAMQFFRISSLDPQSRHYDPQTLERLALLENRFAYLPSDWLARSWQAAGQGEFLSSLLPLLLLLVLAFAFYVLGRSLMAAYLEQTLSPKARRADKRSGAGTMPVSFGWALIARDVKLLVRDSRQIPPLVMFAALVIVFPLLTSQNMREVTGAFHIYMPFLYPLLLTGLFISSNAARLIPLEGRPFGLLKIGPQPFRRIVFTKNLLAAAFGSLIGLISILVSAWSHHASFAPTAQAVVVLLALNLAAAGLGSYFGASFGKFDWEHPKRMLTGAGNFILSLCGAALFLLLFGMMFFGLMLNLIWLALFIVIALCAAVLWLGTILAANKLDSMDWSF